MKPADVKYSTYISFGIENNDRDPKFKVGDHGRISKYKNIFAKGFTPKWSEEVSVIKKVKNTVLKKLTTRPKLLKLKRKYLIIIMANILEYYWNTIRI